MKNAFDIMEYFCDADSIAVGNSSFYAAFPVPDDTHDECEGNVAVVLDPDMARLCYNCPIIGRFGGEGIRVFVDDCSSHQEHETLCDLPYGHYTVYACTGFVAICRE